MLVWMCTWACMWRLKVDTQHLPQLFPTLISKTGSLAAPEINNSIPLADQWAPGDAPVSATPVVWSQAHASTSRLYMGARDLNSDLPAGMTCISSTEHVSPQPPEADTSTCVWIICIISLISHLLATSVSHPGCPVIFNLLIYTSFSWSVAVPATSTVFSHCCCDYKLWHRLGNWKVSPCVFPTCTGTYCCGHFL